MREMKDSGIEWIGEIPEEWKVTNLGYFTQMIVPMRDKPTSFDGNIPWIRIEDFDGKYIDKSKSNQNVSEELIKNMNLKKYPIGTVLCSCSCDLGKCAIVSKEICSNQTFIGIVPQQGKIGSSFLFYLMKSNAERLNYLSSGTIQSYLSRIDFEHLKIQNPPFVQQQQITAYLDSKCAQIDTILEKTKATIEEYKKLKQSVITEAVTKGLDPTVPMKDSGVEWIGRIPEKWKIQKLATVSDIQTGPFGSQLHNEDYVDVGTPIITVEHFGNMIIKHENLPFVCDADCIRLSKYKLNTGDLVFSRVGSVDRSVIVTESEDGWLFSGRCLRVRFLRGFSSKFISYAFCKDEFKLYMKLHAVGSTMPSINTTILSNIRIPVPSLFEQKQIADYLDYKCSQLDTLIEKKQQLVIELESYKKSLIYECVTGKLEVPTV